MVNSHYTISPIVNLDTHESCLKCDSIYSVH